VSPASIGAATGILNVSGADPATWPCALIMVGLSASGKPVLSGAFLVTDGAEEPPSVLRTQAVMKAVEQFGWSFLDTSRKLFLLLALPIVVT